ncbi:MAG: hypothetical protein AB1921_11060 [Thermodesulfobacteriota bacterium]
MNASGEKLNGILLLYHHQIAKNASTIMEHVNAFAQHSKFPVWRVNTELGFPPFLDKLSFSVILLHYSLFGVPFCIGPRFMRYLENHRDTYRIVFLQDEYRYWPERKEFLNHMNIDCVYTLVEPDYFDITYRRVTSVPKLVYQLPGYVSLHIEDMARRYTKPDSQRTVDIGYRGRRLPYYLGRGSQEKHIIGVEFKKRAEALGLTTDIETEENKRIYGTSWPEFLANCKAVLGVEAGVSIFDIDDEVRPQYAKIVTGHPDVSFPDCSFEEVSRTILAPYEDNVYYRTISPRHFEAAALRTTQILFEGKYSGILQPMRHYIPLKKDFSNFDEVIKMFSDASLRKQITDNAYNDLIASRKYTYEKMVEEFDRDLASVGIEPGEDRKKVERVDRALYNDRYRQIFTKVWSVSRHKEFPGRNLLKPIIKPIFQKLGI